MPHSRLYQACNGIREALEPPIEHMVVCTAAAIHYGRREAGTFSGFLISEKRWGRAGRALEKFLPAEREMLFGIRPINSRRIRDSPHWSGRGEELALSENIHVAGGTFRVWHEEVKHEHRIRDQGKTLLFD